MARFKSLMNSTVVTLLALLPISAFAGKHNRALNPCSDILETKGDVRRDQVVMFTEQNLNIYSHGRGEAHHLLRMTAEEYKGAVLKDEIAPDSILIVDYLPLDVDLPTVAGVMTSQPLTLEGSHIQALAEKMGIPLVYAPLAFQDRHIRELAKRSGYFCLQTQSAVQLQKLAQAPPGFADKKRTSVLPAAADRSKKKILGSWQLGGDPIEVLGSKFLALASLPILGDKIAIPHIFDLSPGFYESFLDSAQFQGESLRDFIASRLARAHATKSESKVKLLLTEIRTAIEKADAGIFFNQLAKDWMLTTSLDGMLSVRSNNETEDFFGSGLFASTRTRNASPAQFSLALRKIWRSMYTYRTYTIGRFWGWREENLSMPVLIHPYISGEKLNGTGSFTLKGEELILQLNIVYGNASKATNPNSSVQVQQLKLAQRQGQTVVLDRPADLAPTVEGALIDLYNGLRRVVYNDLTAFKKPPTRIDLEFLVPRSGRPVLLQYKRHYSPEIVVALMKGKIKIAELQEALSKAADDSDEAIIKSIDRLSIDFASAVRLKNYFRNGTERCAFIEINGKPRFILWNELYHKDVQEQLSIVSPKIIWRYGCTATLRDNVLKITPASDDIDAHFTENELRRTLQEEFKMNPRALQGLNDVAIMDAETYLYRNLNINY